MEKVTTCLMYSGGLDSYCAYWYGLYHGFEVKALFVDYDQPYSEREIEAILVNDIPLRIVEIRGLWQLIEPRLFNQIVPSRNVLLAVIGAMVGETVWICTLDGEQKGKEHDKSEYFYTTLTRLLTYTNNAFTPFTHIVSPFESMSKAEVVKWMLTNQPNKLDGMLRTSSCYNDHSKSQGCGSCLTCYKRAQAFYLNKIDTREDYDTDPFSSAYADEMRREIPLAHEQKNYSRFTPKRIREHFKLERMLNHVSNKQTV